MKKINVKTQTIKNQLLLAYIILTALGAYSAAIFYEGSQFATAQAASHIQIVQASPKAPGR